MIKIGMTHTVEKTVTPDMTAKAVGSGGLEVFGTPYMLGLMECAAMWCVQNELPEGKGTVGVNISSSHLAPTPVGMKVTATAEEMFTPTVARASIPAPSSTTPAFCRSVMKSWHVCKPKTEKQKAATCRLLLLPH